MKQFYIYKNENHFSHVHLASMITIMKIVFQFEDWCDYKSAFKLALKHRLCIGEEQNVVETA